MTRHFLADPIDPPVLERVLDAARRVPSAGNTQGFDFVVLCGPAETARYWDVTLPPQRRESFRFAGLLLCSVLVTVWADPAAYVKRYSEPDKAASGLGTGPQAWPTPYWTVDAAFAAMALQYAAIDEGLGVLFFGMFEHAPAVAEALGVPAGHEAVGVVAMGRPGPRKAERSDAGVSSSRPRRPLLRRVGEECPPPGRHAATRPVAHRGRWLGLW